MDGHTLGIAPNYLVTLEVVGRRSGRVISFPLAMVNLDGERYLVSMLGSQAAWVQNVRAAGARPHIPVDKDAPLEAFEAIAAQFPVFRLSKS